MQSAGYFLVNTARAAYYTFPRRTPSDMYETAFQKTNGKAAALECGSRGPGHIPGAIAGTKATPAGDGREVNIHRGLGHAVSPTFQE